jgi:DNA-binding LacI/PurR family transcriptional regulator
MELDRWREFMRDMKEINGLTNAEIAEKAKVSVKTVEQLFSTAPYEQDIMRETARRIEDAVIGSSNQYPCILAFEESAPDERKLFDEVSKELEHARKNLENIHASYNAELQTIRDEAQKKIEYLREQIKRMESEVDYLRRDNERKGEMINKYLLEKFG